MSAVDSFIDRGERILIPHGMHLAHYSNMLQSFLSHGANISHKSTLSLDACLVDVSSMTRLIETLIPNKHIKCLEIKNVFHSEIWIDAISFLLTENSCISMYLLTGNHISSHGLRLWSVPLAHSFAIQVLDLSGNPFGDEGVAHICRGLSKNRSLSQLKLRSCQISCNGVKSIGDLLLENSTLLEIDLAANNIRTNGACILADALVFNSQLQLLDLSFNFVATAGSMAFFEKVTPKCSLKEINLMCNQIEDATLNSILNFCINCPSAQLIILGGNNFTEQAISNFTSLAPGQSRIKERVIGI